MENGSGLRETPFRLEHEFQRDLPRARPAVTERIRSRYIGSTRNGAESGTVHSRVRQPEVRVTEDVEKLRAELQVDAFVDPRQFHHGEISAVVARTDNGIASGVAESSSCLSSE